MPELACRIASRTRGFGCSGSTTRTSGRERATSAIAVAILYLAIHLLIGSVIGIVSSRLTQKYGRPSIVIALREGAGRGSCRSIEDFDLVAALGQCGDLLSKYGGHAMAAGLELQAERLPEFRTRFVGR